jgi:hypothetical protein
MLHSLHSLLVAALLVPFVALSLALVAVVYGIAWNARVGRKR